MPPRTGVPPARGTNGELPLRFKVCCISDSYKHPESFTLLGC